MLTNIAKLEFPINKRMYTLLCNSDSPIQDIKEALFQFQAYIAQVEANVKSQQAQQEAAQAEAVVEVPANVEPLVQPENT